MAGHVDIAGCLIPGKPRRHAGLLTAASRKW